MPNTRTFKIIVFGAHIVLVVMLIYLFSRHNVADDFFMFSRIAPVSSLYGNLQLGWLGYTREVAHIFLTIFDGLAGFMMIGYGLKRKNPVSTYFSVAIGSQLMFSSALSFTLLGLVLWGGIWHLLSAGVAIAMAGSAVISVCCLTIFWKYLLDMGAKQDKFLPGLPPVTE